METIQISRSSFWFKYWSFLALGSPNAPTNTCDLRWALIWRTVMSIAFFPTFIIFICLCYFWKTVKDTFVEDSSFGVGLFAAIQLLSFAAFMAMFNPPILIGYLLGPICVVILTLVYVSIVAALFVVSNNLGKRFFPKKIVKEKKVMLITLLYRSWKDKLCSKIEYIN